MADDPSIMGGEVKGEEATRLLRMLQQMITGLSDGKKIRKGTASAVLQRCEDLGFKTCRGDECADIDAAQYSTDKKVREAAQYESVQGQCYYPSTAEQAKQEKKLDKLFRGIGQHVRNIQNLADMHERLGAESCKLIDTDISRGVGTQADDPEDDNYANRQAMDLCQTQSACTWIPDKRGNINAQDGRGALAGKCKPTLDSMAHELRRWQRRIEEATAAGTTEEDANQLATQFGDYSLEEINAMKSTTLREKLRNAYLADRRAEDKNAERERVKELQANLGGDIVGRWLDLKTFEEVDDACRTALRSKNATMQSCATTGLDGTTTDNPDKARVCAVIESKTGRVLPYDEAKAKDQKLRPGDSCSYQGGQGLTFTSTPNGTGGYQIDPLRASMSMKEIARLALIESGEKIDDRKIDEKVEDLKAMLQTRRESVRQVLAQKGLADKNVDVEIREFGIGGGGAIDGGAKMKDYELNEGLAGVIQGKTNVDRTDKQLDKDSIKTLNAVFEEKLTKNNQTPFESDGAVTTFLKRKDNSSSSLRRDIATARLDLIDTQENKRKAEEDELKERAEMGDYEDEKAGAKLPEGTGEGMQAMLAEGNDDKGKNDGKAAADERGVAKGRPESKVEDVVGGGTTATMGDLLTEDDTEYTATQLSEEPTLF